MIRKLLGSIWVSPITVVVWVFYILPFWALRFIQLGEVIEGEPIVLFEANFRDRWYSRLWNWLWRGWNGHCLPHAIVVRPEVRAQVIDHEVGHHPQWLSLGLLFPIVYFLMLVYYGYGDHPLELAADEYVS